MCLILLAHRARPGIALLAAANRDEFFERPASQAAFWTDHPHVLAGRDLKAGGTWLGVTRSGRFAAITNYRNPGERLVDAPSRGALVSDFLLGDVDPEEYLRGLAPRAGAYNGFSLLLGAEGGIWFFSNRDGGGYRVEAGIHGLSNHFLNEPWPKVERGKMWLARLIDKPFDAEDYLELLADETVAPDGALPDTGVGLERERRLSSIRIRGAAYGTRCSTVLLVRDSGEVEFHERSFASEGAVVGTVSHRFVMEQRQGPSSTMRAQSSLPRKSGRAW